MEPTFAVPFRIRPVSMYSIRVPYSYQCARTYPLPAPSTLKGLCANALWQWSRDAEHPVTILKRISTSAVCATCRAESLVLVTSCTVSQVVGRKARNALLRQFAHALAIRGLLLLTDRPLASELCQALPRASLYLGDSESLIHVDRVPDEPIPLEPVAVAKGQVVGGVNTLVPESLMERRSKPGPEVPRGTVLLMQVDPISPKAELARHVAPLRSVGDDYEPIDQLPFVAASECLTDEVQGLNCVWVPRQTEQPKKTRTRRRRR